MIIANTSINTSKQLVYFGKSWTEAIHISLQGNIFDCDLSNVYNLPTTILNQYKTGYNTYTIQGYTINFAIVKNVSLNNAGLGKYSFSIEFDGYSWNQLGTIGILDPTNEWNITEEQDGSTRLTHTVSARGLSGQNSLSIAKSFVSSLAGIGGYTSGLSSLGSNVPCVISSGLTENSINGTASLIENYILDPSGSPSGIVRYTVNVEESYNNIATATIEGDILGCNSGAATYLYNNLNFTSLISGVAGTGFNNQVSNGYSSSVKGKHLTFNAVYNTDSGSIFVDYSINVATDVFSTVSIKGTLKGLGDLKHRWDAVSGAFGGRSWVYSLLNSGYSGDFPLNSNVLSYGESWNIFLGEVGFSATYNDKALPPNGFTKFDYTINIIPPLQQYAVEPLLNQDGRYFIMDMNYHNRGTISIQGQGITNSGISPSSQQTNVRKYIEKICLSASNGTPTAKEFILESVVFNINESGRFIGFSESWSFEGDKFSLTGVNNITQ